VAEATGSEWALAVPSRFRENLRVFSWALTDAAGVGGAVVARKMSG